MNKISNQEFFDISMRMEVHHSIFYKMWNIGVPVFSVKIPTAAVYFDNDGKELIIELNESFWNSLTDNQKDFVICHELLHAVLNHGIRSSNLNHKISNIAQDIVINEKLIKSYGFNRLDIDPNSKYCWIDNVFGDIACTIERGRNFEYYYNKLMENIDNLNQLSTSDYQTVDVHDMMNNTSDFIDKLNGELSPEEKESIRDFVEDNVQEYQNAGNSTGGLIKFADVTTKQKRKWETVIKKWANMHLKENDKDIEQWQMINRRHSLLPNDMFLPTEYEVEDIEKIENRITVWFFQDTSGSCSSFINRFFKAAASLPKDRFDVKMHCFDTRVFETTLESGKLYGFGGTSFTCIEYYIQNYCKKNNESYPKAVFVVTDGFGNIVKPEKPENWFWFLSGNYIECIPKQSKIFKLSDYE